MTLKKLEDPKIKAAHERMKKVLPNDDLRLSFYATCLGCAKVLGDFIVENYEPQDLPREVQYILAQTWNQYCLVFLPDKLKKGAYSEDFQNYFESGDLDDRFATVVKQLYQICKEEKLL